MSHKNLLTQEGYTKLVEQLKEFKSTEDHLIAQIEEVAQPDESGEDGLVTQLKDELEVIGGKIEKLEEVLENIEIISGGCEYDEVKIGCKVKIKISGNITKEFNIVNQLEADPMTNKISDQSPLGVALLGKKIDDEVEVSAPVGKIKYKIVSIG
jgi:transcription elongation factor GreA